MNFRNELTGRSYSVLAIALFGVLGLGAKGCDRAVVGDDGDCENCTGGESGAASGGSENAGTGGTGQAGAAGSATAGRGGSGNGSAGKSGSAGSGNGGITCGGLGGGDCPAGAFCDYPLDAICGAADATGVCRAIPEACTLEDIPVCGCDGETYSNACLAASAGVSVARGGACEPEGDVCGGLRGDQCAGDEYCDYPPDANCGRADATGICLPKPEACDAVYLPVCGCDDTTYGNECEAALAGVSAETEGECEGDEPVEGSCGGLTGKDCPEGTFCNYPLETQCGAGDQTGTCQAIPEGCTLQYDPVCGCDDKTYGNACAAATAGVSVAATGECPSKPEIVCGGIAALQCPEGTFCDYPIEAQCGAGDMTGTCLDKPEVCAGVVDLVCGCDGTTYSSRCIANGAGVAVQSEDACPE